MADADDTTRAGDDDDRTCRPCRGTGRVISNLGGTPRQVTCPWCEGAGVQEPGHDAQAAAAAHRAS
jgi:DnaJ-class molecular chaperone